MHWKSCESHLAQKPPHHHKSITLQWGNNQPYWFNPFLAPQLKKNDQMCSGTHQFSTFDGLLCYGLRVWLAHKFKLGDFLGLHAGRSVWLLMLPYWCQRPPGCKLDCVSSIIVSMCLSGLSLSSIFFLPLLILSFTVLQSQPFLPLHSLWQSLTISVSLCKVRECAGDTHSVGSAAGCH